MAKKANKGGSHRSSQTPRTRRNRRRRIEWIEWIVLTIFCPLYPWMNARIPWAHILAKKKRCSDKGFLAMADADYLEILDWLARNTVAGKRGSTPADAPAIFERLGIDGVACSKVVKDFGRVFKNVAGKSTSIERARSLKTGRKFYRARV